MDDGFKYVMDHGITGESAYAYTGRNGKCKTNEGSFKVSKFTDVKAGSVSGLAAAVAK